MDCRCVDIVYPWSGHDSVLCRSWPYISSRLSRFKSGTLTAPNGSVALGRHHCADIAGGQWFHLSNRSIFSRLLCASYVIAFYRAMEQVNHDNLTVSSVRSGRLTGRAPAAFVNHFQEAPACVPARILYDPFEGTTMPGVYFCSARGASVPETFETRREVSPGSDSMLINPANKVSEDEYPRRVAIRSAYNGLVTQRIDLQGRSGQACWGANTYSKGRKGLHLDDPATPQRLRQISQRDYPHARWVTAHAARLIYCAEVRDTRLETMRKRRQANLTLEMSCGLSPTRGNNRAPPPGLSPSEWNESAVDVCEPP